MLSLSHGDARPDERLYANQARRDVGKSSFDLAPRSLLSQLDRTSAIESNNVKRVLPDIDAAAGPSHCRLYRQLVRAADAFFKVPEPSSRIARPYRRSHPNKLQLRNETSSLAHVELSSGTPMGVISLSQVHLKSEA